MGELENFKKKKEREKYESTPRFQRIKGERELREKEKLDKQKHYEKTLHLREKIAPLVKFLNDCHKDLEKQLKYKYYTGHGTIQQEFNLETSSCKLIYEKIENDYKDYKLPGILGKISGLFNYNDPIESWYRPKDKWWRKEIKTTHSLVWEYDFPSKVLSCKRFSEVIPIENLENNKEKILEYFLTIKKWYFKKEQSSKIVRYFHDDHNESTP